MNSIVINISEPLYQLIYGLPEEQKRRIQRRRKTPPPTIISSNAVAVAVAVASVATQQPVS